MPAFRCPACDAEYSHGSPVVEAVCGYCGTAVVLDGLLCPICHRLSDLDADACGACSEPFTNFGRALKMQADARQPPLWLTQTRQRAIALKEGGEIRSRARMRVMMGIEQKRQESIRAAMLKRQEHDRRLLLTAALLLVAMFLSVILATLLLA